MYISCVVDGNIHIYMVFVEENLWVKYLHLEGAVKILVHIFWKDSNKSKFQE